jgi:hypothetical protein
VERLVELAMTYAVEEYDDDLAAARLVMLARDDQAALDQACDVCLSYTDIDLGIQGRAIGLLAQVLGPDLPPDHATWRQRAPRPVGHRSSHGPVRCGTAGAVTPFSSDPPRHWF